MIDRNLLCYVSPLPLVPNRFMNVCKNKLRIFDGDLNICLEKECPIDFAEQSTVDGVRTSDSYTQYQPVFSGGRIYIQVRSSVYEYVGDQVIFLDKIPNFNMKTAGYYYGRLFSLNEQLFGSDTEGGIYQLVNDRFKHVRPGKYGYYFNFCGQTLIWYLKDGIYKLSPDFIYSEKTELVQKTGENINFVSGTLAGTLVLHDKGSQQVFLTSILNGKSVECQTRMFEVLKIAQQTVLDAPGIIIGAEVLNQYCGAGTYEFSITSFKEYFLKQQELPGFRREQFENTKAKLIDHEKIMKQLQCSGNDAVYAIIMNQELRMTKIETELAEIKNMVQGIQQGQNTLIQILSNLGHNGIE
ncbi:Conserved_hypothetical protein [Hexamita inflata]|uniref:Uncharacterized protein n=1 Tax=Hexamita inflata TaxID=28002 RepID=A0AA86UYV9_9EUKA|nr:Conserved hypothetical protein [Hexamita inflata]